jgi:hypothetical protein
VTSRLAFLLVLAAALGGFALGRMAGGAEPAVVTPPQPQPVPGERSLELAQVRRVTLRLSAATEVAPQIADAEATIRRRLHDAGVLVVPFNQPHDAVVWAHIDAHQFRAYDAHGVAAELHLAADHRVSVDGEIRVIPHDLWQSDSMRLVQPELISREIVQSVDELASHLASALRRSRDLDR